jgi:hypothetical protein
MPMAQLDQTRAVWLQGMLNAAQRLKVGPDRVTQSRHHRHHRHRHPTQQMDRTLASTPTMQNATSVSLVSTVSQANSPRYLHAHLPACCLACFWLCRAALILHACYIGACCMVCSTILSRWNRYHRLRKQPTVAARSILPVDERRRVR